MNKYTRVKCLNVTYSLSSHHHGHCLLHIHLPASSTLDKIVKEKWGKKEERNVSAMLTCSLLEKQMKQKERGETFIWAVINEERIINFFFFFFCCRKGIFASLKNMKDLSERSSVYLIPCISDIGDLSFAAHFTHLHCSVATKLSSGEVMCPAAMISAFFCF